MKKSILGLLVGMVFICSMLPSAFAASTQATEAADTLYEMGLFQGTGMNEDGSPIYELDRSPTRYEAITMLVRLLGKDADAKGGNWTTPFTDVADWAKPYVGYAYTNGLTSGTSETEYGGDQNITVSQYLTFAMRALGYESGTDFQWDRAWELSDQLGITNGQYAENSAFTRGDVAIISLAALNTPVKQEEKTLLEKMQEVPAQQNILYDDQFVKITYKGMEPLSDYESYVQKEACKVRFEVENKGAAYYDGITYPQICVVCSDISVNGDMNSWNFMGAPGCVVMAGETTEFVVDVTDVNLDGGLQTLSALFQVLHGQYLKGEGTYVLAEDEVSPEVDFTAAGVTEAYVEPYWLTNGEANLTPPAPVEGTLVYTDDNFNLYFGGLYVMPYYYVQNKTGQLLKLENQSVTINGQTGTDATPLFSRYDYQVVLPYSTNYMELAGVPDNDESTTDPGALECVFVVTVGENSYTITV